MSKSLGNVVDPKTVIEGGKDPKDIAFGADVLRLWVSSVDYTSDVTIGTTVLHQMSDIYRKLRGTLRFLLGNLHDWKIIQRFVVVDLSNFYLDIAKDRLYVGGSTSATRRSCQTVLAAHLLSVVTVIAPILPHLAEDVWQHLPFQFTSEDGHIASSVFQLRWPVLNQRYLDFPEEDVFWGTILELRTEVNRVLENARTAKLIGSSLQAKVFLHASDNSMVTRLVDMCASENDADALHRIFLTSQVEILPSLVIVTSEGIPCTGEYLIEGKNKVWIGVSRANGSKCERCWNYSPQVGEYSDHPSLCGRCHGIISQH